jgi:hypothetical protein
MLQGDVTKSHKCSSVIGKNNIKCLIGNVK